MVYWAPFLHFYQPPTQFHAILQKICRESYRPLVKLFASETQARVTVNICGVLTQMLNDHGGKDIIDGMARLAGKGRLEFVESAKYHPILTLIPPDEIRRQIEHNNITNTFFFKKAYKPKGFFSPEMCYSDDLAGILSDMNYKWLLIAGLACRAAWPLDVIYKIQRGKKGIAVFNRDDVLSNKISFHGLDSKGFISELLALRGKHEDIYVITAMDAETFGHHIQHWEKLFLGEVYTALERGVRARAWLRQKTDLAREHRDIFLSKHIKDIRVVTISELLEKFPVKEAETPLPSSWSSSKEDIQRGNYYPLWNDNANPIHKLQWEHADICFDLVSQASAVNKGSDEARRFADISRLLIDRAIHSCQFWWANKGRMWDINMVNKGLMLQEEVVFNAYKAISLSSAGDDVKKGNFGKVVKARELANKIRDLLIL